MAAHYTGGDIINAVLAKLRREGEHEADLDRLTELILRALELRRISLSCRSLLRITRSRDVDELLRWFDSAVSASHEDDVFSSDEPRPNSPGEKALDKGRAEGALARQRTLILRVLSKRGAPPTPAMTERVRLSQNQSQLDRWFEQAVLATDPTVFFTPEPSDER